MIWPANDVAMREQVLSPLATGQCGAALAEVCERICADFDAQIREAGDESLVLPFVFEVWFADDGQIYACPDRVDPFLRFLAEPEPIEMATAKSAVTSTGHRDALAVLGPGTLI